jgi:hypothetical protein
MLFNVGDIIFNNAPGLSGPLCWICTVASASIGAVGTWLQVASAGSDSAKQTAFGSAPLTLFHAQYNFANDGGADSLITLKNNVTLPINAVIVNCFFNSTTALVGSGASVAFGTSAGSSATSLLAATAITSFTLNAFVHGVPTPQTASTFVKLTAAGQITMTPSAAVLTAGVIEVYGEYYVSST